jgi:hypothetical protein
MNDSLSRNAIIDLLGVLSRWLDVKAPGRRFELLVVGGAALALSGDKDRTFDVDVLRPARLEPVLEQGVSAVARSRGLPSGWLSTSVAEIFARLRAPRHWPAYFDEIDSRLDIGGNLSVLVAGRQALISLKLFAASPSVAKHTDDLLALEPTPAEIRTAIDFVRSIDATEVRRDDLRSVLGRLGLGPETLAGWPR